MISAVAVEARDDVWALRPHWGCLGGSVEQRGILLEAIAWRGEMTMVDATLACYPDRVNFVYNVRQKN